MSAYHALMDTTWPVLVASGSAFHVTIPALPAQTPALVPVLPAMTVTGTMQEPAGHAIQAVATATVQTISPTVLAVVLMPH